MIILRVGMVHTPKELILEQDFDVSKAISLFDQAMTKGSGMLWLEDSKGRQTGINTEKIAYVEISLAEERTVGFKR